MEDVLLHNCHLVDITPAWAHLTVGADDLPDPALARLVSRDERVEDMSILLHNCSVARVRRAPLEDLMEPGGADFVH